jgi:hypothetical protein
MLHPDLAEPVSLGALPEVENGPDDGRASNGMKRDGTLPRGIHQIEVACWSVPCLDDRTPSQGPEMAVPVFRRS